MNGGVLGQMLLPGRGGNAGTKAAAAGGVVVGVAVIQRQQQSQCTNKKPPNTQNTHTAEQKRGLGK